MKCVKVKPLLAELVYDEIADEQRSAVEQHLYGCETCRAEWRELAEARRQLDHLPVETARPGLDLLPLYESARRRAVESRRRWRRAAMAAGLAVAVLAVAAVGPVRVAWQESRLSISWDRARAIQPDKQTQQRDDRSPAVSSVEERLAKLEELTNLAIREFLQTDQRRTAELDGLQNELASLERSHDRRFEQFQAQADERWRLLLDELSLIHRDERFAQAEWLGNATDADPPFTSPEPQE